jgi:hypothetical protein
MSRSETATSRAGSNGPRASARAVRFWGQAGLLLGTARKRMLLRAQGVLCQLHCPRQARQMLNTVSLDMLV